MSRLDEIDARLRTVLDAVEDGNYVHSEADEGLVYTIDLSANDAERLLESPATTVSSDLVALLRLCRASVNLDAAMRGTYPADVPAAIDEWQAAVAAFGEASHG